MYLILLVSYQGKCGTTPTQILSILNCLGGLPLIMLDLGDGGDKVSYTFPLHITFKKGEGYAIQIACKLTNVLPGRPF